MASQEITMPTVLEAENTITKLSLKMKSASKSMDKYSTRLERYGVDTKGLAISWAKNIISFSQKSVVSAQQQVGNELKLASALKHRTNAAKGQISSIMKLISAQQANGVVSDELQMAGAQQLTTYTKNSNSIKTLIPAMNNLLVAQKGTNGTTKDAGKIADSMGAALNGQTDKLKKAGIAFSASEEKVLRFGTEQEKAAMLARVINNNVGEANKEMANTDVGKIQNACIQYQNLKEQIGQGLLPYLGKLAEYFSQISAWITANPIKATFIISFIVAFVSLLAIIISFSKILMLVSIVQGIFNLTLGMCPIILIAAGIAALIAVVATLIIHWDKVTAAVSKFFSLIFKKFPILKKIIKAISNFFKHTGHPILAKIFGKIGKQGDSKEKSKKSKKEKNDSVKKVSAKGAKSKEEKKKTYIPYQAGALPNIKGLKKKNIDEFKGLDNLKGKNLNKSYGKDASTYINEANGKKGNKNSEINSFKDKSNKIIENKTVTFGNIYITAKGVTADEVIKKLVPKLKLQLANI